MSAISNHDLGYAQVYIFQNYLINQINDGVNVGMEHVEVLRDMITEHFGNRKMVYISNRTNSYSVNPLVYPLVGRIRNLEGMAIVTNSRLNIQNANFEKVFYHKHFEIFQTMDEAIVWATELISSADVLTI
ncbi:hypothetical protein [Nonlabens marinus]|uniref:STAS/SEC14 domain-containing protein n=1 Tax=Nonlabens marinus S1-08 TaxID=1454201 RepID=W8VN95_9FLAO|nr:hypothetical protein [Nonlabens marinus]BAO54314.1 hypothetical protein NMS_0305 [Nonlabens marinus S1-08]